MTPIESATRLATLFAADNIALASSTPREGIEKMFSFYETVPCDGCEADALLFQWGTYDWGDGEFFEFDITRQFIEADAEGDDAISQLSLTYKFLPTEELSNLEDGNCWNDGPQPFREVVLNSASFLALADKRPHSVELSHSYV